MKPIRLKMRAYNNRLVRLREELGLSQKELADRVGLSQGTVNTMETMREPAWGAHGWKTAALKLAEFHGVSPEWLWPDEIRMVRAKAMQLEATSQEIAQLGGVTPLQELTARETSALIDRALTVGHYSKGLGVQMLRARIEDEKTFAEVGTIAGLSHAGAHLAVKRIARRVLSEVDEAAHAWLDPADGRILFAANESEIKKLGLIKIPHESFSDLVKMRFAQRKMWADRFRLVIGSVSA